MLGRGLINRSRTRLPELTMDGDINLGANKLKFTTTLIKESGSVIRFRNTNDAAYISIHALIYYIESSIEFAASGAFISAGAGDDRYGLLKARDNTIGEVEIGRFAGAADPYFQIGRDDTGVAAGAVTDMLVLQAGAGTTAETAGFGFGTSIKLGNDASEVEERISIDYVLVTNTNGSEAARIDYNVMGGGSEVAKVLQIASDRVSVNKILGYGTVADLTIATGVVAVVQTYHSIIVEGGAGGGNDQLDTATGGSEGDMLIIKTKTAGTADTVTVADATGSDTFILAGGANFVLDHIDDRLMCIHNGTEWVEISRSSNS